jgi:hypothetical protein
MLLDEEGPSLFGHGTIHETGAAHLSNYQRRDRARHSLAGFEGNRGQAQSADDQLSNYFCLGPVGKAYTAVDIHARTRLRRWLCDKHNERRPAYKGFPEAPLHSVFGLVQLPHQTASLP